jgi:hypothetical protein
MRFLDGVGVGVAGDALLRAIAVKKLEALVKGRGHHSILVDPRPSQESGIGGVCFDDEEAHLEAESRHLDLHRDGPQCWLPLVVEAANHHVSGLQVIHRETCPFQAPNRQYIHSRPRVDEDASEVRDADVPLHVEWTVMGAVLYDVVLLVERDLIHEQGVCEETVFRHAHLVEFWSLERLDKGFTQARHHHECIVYT